MANGLGSATMLSPGMLGGPLGALGFGALGPAAAFAFAPALLSKLFGGDPQKKYRRQVANLYSPQNISRLTNQFYQGTLMSPAYSRAQGTIAAGANLSNQNLASSLAQRGLGTSGIGAILGSVTPSITAGQLGGLRTAAYGSAQQNALQSIQQQLAALQGTQGPSQTQQYLAGGFESFAPFLNAFLKQRYPGAFGMT